jgi:hypothetical protein
MALIATSLRMPEQVNDLVEQLMELRGMTKADVIVLGILAQAEAFGLIPSARDVLAGLKTEPATDAGLRERQRLSQQRSRARKQGEPVPVAKRGRPRRNPVP